MGGEEITNKNPLASLNEYLNKLCSYALSIGMPYELYWHGDPDAINYYIEAEQVRVGKKNTELWLQGLYIYSAIGRLAPVLNPLVQNHKPKPYFDKPIPLTEEERQREELLKYERMKEYMTRLVKGEESNG